MRTTDEKAAQKIVYAKNEADQQPALNLHLAKAYLAGTDGAMTTRTWGDALLKERVRVLERRTDERVPRRAR